MAKKHGIVALSTRAKEGEEQALTTPLSYTGSPEELDAELGKHLASYVDCHVQLGSTLAEAKAEMDAAAKAARQKAKTTHQTSKSDPAPPKQETTAATATVPETTPSLFASQHLGAEPVNS